MNRIPVLLEQVEDEQKATIADKMLEELEQECKAAEQALLTKFADDYASYVRAYERAAVLRQALARLRAIRPRRNYA